MARLSLAIIALVALVGCTGPGSEQPGDHDEIVAGIRDAVARVATVKEVESLHYQWQAGGLSTGPETVLVLVVRSFSEQEDANRAVVEEVTEAVAPVLTKAPDDGELNLTVTGPAGAAPAYAGRPTFDELAARFGLERTP